MSDDNSLNNLSDQFRIMFGQKTGSTKTPAEKRKWRQMPDDSLTYHAKAGSPHAQRELKRRYGNQTPEEYWGSQK